MNIKIFNTKMAVMAIFVFITTSVFANNFSLNGKWLDTDNNITTILQSEGKIILNSKNIKMNGTISGSTLSINSNGIKLTGTISESNLTITWNNGSVWYRDISGTWEGKDSTFSTVEQAANILRIKNNQGVTEFLGFVQNNGFTLINNVTKVSISGTLTSPTEIKWSDGIVWKK